MRKSGLGRQGGWVLTIAAAVGLAGCATAQSPARDAAQAVSATPAEGAPCYMIVMGTVTDRVGFQGYTAALPPLYQRFGGRYLAIQRNPAVLEGEYPHTSVVMSQWPSCTAAQAFWASPEYRQLVEMRKNWGEFDVILAPGLPPPLPADR